MGEEVLALPLKTEIGRGGKTDSKGDVYYKLSRGKGEKEGAWCTKETNTKEEYGSPTGAGVWIVWGWVLHAGAELSGECLKRSFKLAKERLNKIIEEHSHPFKRGSACLSVT